MSKMTFYRQARIDGGIRTGLEWEDHRAFEFFQEGPPEEADHPIASGLLWYVDLRCEGEGLPPTADEGRDWLVNNKNVIQDGLTRLSEEVRAGWDLEEIPVKWKDFTGLPPGVTIEVVMSAMRRIDSRQLSDVLKDLAEHWEQYLNELEPYTLVDR